LFVQKRTRASLALLILLCIEVEVAGIKHGVERDGELTSQ
jgi:hypothetical protein